MLNETQIFSFLLTTVLLTATPGPDNLMPLFFLSFLPPFVNEAQGHVEWQLGWLGVLFSLQAAILFGVLGHFAGAIGTWLNRRPAASRWLDRAAGAIFVALGLRMMASR